MQGRPENPRKRFWRKVEIKGPDDCWNWIGYKDRNGYGQFRVSPGKCMYAHRFALEYSQIDSIPKDLYVLHKCDNPACCNPKHLYIGTQTDIMLNVYIVNKSVHDFSAATKFGELIYLSEGSINRFNTSGIYRKFYPILKNSHKDDYLLITGLTIMNLIAAFIFAMKHKRLNLLLFKTYKNKKEYLERILIGDENE